MEYGSSHQSIIVRAGSRTKKERLLVQRFAEEFDGLFEAGSLIFFSLVFFLVCVPTFALQPSLLEMELSVRLANL